MRVTLFACVIFFIGCSENESMEVETCKDIASSVVGDPSDINWNDVSEVARPMDKYQLKEKWRKRWEPDDIPDASSAALERYMSMEGGFESIHVNLDLTSSGAQGGPSRIRMTCDFLHYANIRELERIFLNGDVYDRRDFILLFARIGMPKGMDSLYRIK